MAKKIKRKKLSDKIISEMEDRFIKTGDSLRMIAKDFGVSLSTISRKAKEAKWEEKRIMHAKTSENKIEKSVSNDNVEIPDILSRARITIMKHLSKSNLKPNEVKQLTDSLKKIAETEKIINSTKGSDIGFSIV